MRFAYPRFLLCLYLLFLFPRPLAAIDLNLGNTSNVASVDSSDGTEDSNTGDTTTQPNDKPKKVKVVNGPVEVRLVDQSKIQEIVSGGSVNTDGIYRSDYIEVKDYKEIAFYVKPEKDVHDPQKAAAVFQLNAFFSIENGKPEEEPGHQEFGAWLIEGPDTEKPHFLKTTTGETSSRVLFTPIYGPYVRVELKNSNPGDTRKFKITAFLNR